MQHYIYMIYETSSFLGIEAVTWFTNIAHKKKKKKKKKLTPSTWFTGTRLMSPSGVKTYRKIDRQPDADELQYGKKVSAYIISQTSKHKTNMCLCAYVSDE